jgi:hypothetical protein
VSDQSKVEVPLEGNAWCCDGGSITHKGNTTFVRKGFYSKKFFVRRIFVRNMVDL